MAIYGDITGISGESPSSQSTLDNGFFTQESGIEIPEAELSKPSESVEPAMSDFDKDWRSIVNRSFMRGLTNTDIYGVFGQSISRSRFRDEIIRYLKKYEGLVGTVFVDSSVVSCGFPMSMIPKRYRAYNRYAINCNDVKLQSLKGVSGGSGGDIDSFLNAYDGNVESTREVCAVTGLPVLRKGMFGKEEIAEVLSELGVSGETLSDLREAMRERLLGIAKGNVAPADCEKPDTAFSLQEGEVEAVAMPEQGKGGVSLSKYNLRQAAVNAVVSPKRKVMSRGVAYGKASVKEDISEFDHTRKAMRDGDLELRENRLVAKTARSSKGMKVAYGKASVKEDISEFDHTRKAMRNGRLGLRENEVVAEPDAPRRMAKVGYAFSGKADISRFDKSRKASSPDVGLEDAELRVDLQDAPGAIDGVNLEYARSRKGDVRMEGRVSELDDVRIDDQLRF